MTKVTKTVAKFLSRIFGGPTPSPSSQTESSVLSATWRLEMTPLLSGFSRTASMGRPAKQGSCSTTKTPDGCSNCSGCPHQSQPTIRTSRPNHLVLFVDKEDLVSQVALKNLDLALEGTDYRCYTAVLEKQYHTAVCISYDITEFPTLLVLDNAGQVLHSDTRARNLHETYLRSLLHAIDSYRTTNL